MFGDVAVTLLKMAGHSGTVPGALLAGDIPAALARLEHATAAGAEETGKASVRPDGEDEDSPPVGLGLRAYPLVQLLSAAAAQGCDVMWERDRPAVNSPIG